MVSCLIRYTLLATLVLFVIVSRAAYVSDFAGVNRDGPMYIAALDLDSRTYEVPAPGKIGFVLLAAAARKVGANPIHAYAVVTIGLSVVATVFIFLFATLYVPRAIAGAVTLAVMCGPIVWVYGSVIASYIVWLACFPAIAYFGVRYVRERRPGLAIATATAVGLASILRADMTAFAGPLLVGVLALGRAPFKYWVLSAAIGLGSAAVWFFSSAAVSGGLAGYLYLIREQREYHFELGVGGLGLMGGLVRNGVKYSLFLLWDAAPLLLPAALFVYRQRGAIMRRRKELALVTIGLAPILLFSGMMVTCTGGLIFPLLPLLGVAAGRGLLDFFGGRSHLVVASLLLIAAVSTLQFVYAPILSNGRQRNVIVNVMFTKQAGPAIRQRYYYNLEDFDMDSSLANVLRQMRANDPVPRYPADFRGSR